jgi:hypothetical protein
MKVSEVRDWLGKYFLVFTVILGGYIILFSGKDTIFLRVSREVGMNCFQIIVPTLVGQITIIFRFFAGTEQPDTDDRVTVPSWIVKWPPTLLAGLLVFTVLLMALGNLKNGQTWSPSEDDFKTVLLFYVTVLNATTVLVVSKYFELPKRRAGKPVSGKPT